MAGPITRIELVLRGKTVAFTGKLASMTRPEAVELVRAHGGEWSASVTLHTSLLVVGQEGWPLRQDGRLSLKLAKARRLQSAGSQIAIATEEEMLARLGLESRSEGIHRLYTTVQLSEILGVPGAHIRGWIQGGLIQPVQTEQGLPYFDFQQVTSAKTLCGLARAGISPDRIRQSLQRLSKWLPGVEQPLAQLTVLENSRQLLVRRDDGMLAEATGQLLFDFTEDVPETAGVVAEPQDTAQQWFERGCEYEERGQLSEAVDAYRHALLLGGPDADICFNLANAYYLLGKREQAAERFRQVVEIDHDHAEAWNNLGNVLGELKQHEDALDAYQRALAIAPHYADAHYNLADLLEMINRPDKARRHWQAYLSQDSHSRWANYARKRLAANR